MSSKRVALPIYPPRGNARFRGRGVISNATGRFEKESREDFNDGWEPHEAPPSALRTLVTDEAARSVISPNDSPDISFDRAVNPYRGCEHGCVYCYARPNHAYVGLSPGLDFETRLFAKSNAAEALEAELRAPGYRPSVLMLSGVTDCYQPIERERRITRKLLETLLAFRHPVAIITKSALILRDLDILSEMARLGLVKAALSITTLNRGLARRMEPRASAPHRRLEAVAGLAAAGVPVSVMMAPIVPGLTDHEIEDVLKAASRAGARAAGYVLLRLPLEVRDLVHEFLDEAIPERAARIKRLIRDTRGGADYQSAFGLRQRGTGPYAAQIAARFHAALKRHGLDRPSLALDTSQFRAPPRPGDQLPLFDGGLPLASGA
jgi:DNA repair photolyase